MLRTRRALTWIALAACAHAQLRLPHVLADHMVLQRESEVPLWGWGEPGEVVHIKAEWAADEVQAIVDPLGTWRARVATSHAGGPYTIAIRGGGEITLRDVWLGEVWLASGQSNMEFTVAPDSGNGGCDDFQREIASADHPRIREFRVAHRASYQTLRDCEGQWSTCSPQSVGSFSAVAYFFARELEREIDCPVGVIVSTWGGTAADAWMSDTALRGLKFYDAEIERLNRIRRGEKEALAIAPVDQHTPSALFNGMIAPLFPYALRGILWYQGEANVERAEPYGKVFGTLITDWRWQWAQGELPFYWVQIAPWRYPNDRGQAASVRDFQRRSLGPPNNGMACALDLGDPNDIHPRNKQEVGRRLSLWALAKVYGRNGLEHSGPVFRAMTAEGSSARLSFGHTASGLVARGELAGFELAGEDKHFFPARARIDGETVVCDAEQVAAPVAVRYAWAADATASLYNGAGLPAPSFRSDNWPVP